MSLGVRVYISYSIDAGPGSATRLVLCVLYRTGSIFCFVCGASVNRCLNLVIISPDWAISVKQLIPLEIITLCI